MFDRSIDTSLTAGSAVAVVRIDFTDASEKREENRRDGRRKIQQTCRLILTRGGSREAYVHLSTWPMNHRVLPFA